MNDQENEKEQKRSKLEGQMTEALEYAKWRDSFQRKNFDYQERWHGWQSPVGLGVGILATCAGLYLLSLAITNLR